MFLYNLLYMIYSKKPIFLALEFLNSGGIGEMQFGSCFIFSLFKGLCSLFCKPRPREGVFLQQQQQVSLRIQELALAEEEQQGPGHSQNWLLYFFVLKILTAVAEGSRPP